MLLQVNPAETVLVCLWCNTVDGKKFNQGKHMGILLDETTGAFGFFIFV
jgi:hypothetical protein